MDDVEQRPQASSATYTVGAEPTPDQPKTRYAIFLTHGMGQPIPFQTIDHVARSLHQWDIKHDHENPKPNAATVKSGQDWLNRIELRLKSGAEAVEVHLYEGYWAPMTEGRTTARNVMGFLAGAGFNAVRHTQGAFKRWLFHQYEPVPIPARTVLFLLTALATVASLVVINSTIAIVAATRAVLGEEAGWLSHLFDDLTTTLNLVVSVMFLFGVSLFVAVRMRKRKWGAGARQRWSLVTVGFFVLALVVVIFAGLAIPFFFYGHARGLAGPSPIWDRSIPAVVECFNNVFDWLALVGVLGFALFIVGRWIRRIDKALATDLEDKETAPLTSLVADGFLLLSVALALVAAYFMMIFAANSRDGWGFVRHGLAWPLLVAASAYIRLVLVQYVGDVAIYVMPYKLDAFTDLRREIKLRVYKAARAVYAQREYDKVIVVAHSLGSVIAYDALNMLILEDNSIQDTKESWKAPDDPPDDFLDVVNRTPLFLTFGCPLDKTAFVFSVQAKGTSEAREALAGSVQPMIVDYAYRPKRWINIWSPWDIISGPLDLYDFPMKPRTRPDNPLSQHVFNEPDEDATTLLMAHTEYWNNPLLVRRIYDEIGAL